VRTHLVKNTKTQVLTLETTGPLFKTIENYKNNRVLLLKKCIN